MSMKHCLDMMYIYRSFPYGLCIPRFLVGARPLLCFAFGGSFVFLRHFQCPHLQLTSTASDRPE